MIIDDERLVRWSLRQKCEEWGYHVAEAAAGEPGLRMAQQESPDLVLLDVRMPDLNGIQVLEQLKKMPDAPAVIMITADPQLDDVKSALKLGAYDFIGKPLDFEELHVTIQNALEASRLRTEVQSLRGEVRRNTGYHEVVAVSPKTMELMSFVQKVAASEATTILIQGESGTGKDLIAKTIHYESTRENGPFVAINCSAIPETLMEAELFGHERGAFTDAKQMKKGLFETANGGTLFLDEIGELSPLLQAKLLRVLEDEFILRPVYMPFAVGEAARSGLTAFEASSTPADGGGGKQLANGRMLPRLYIPEEGTSLEEVERAMVELAMRQANNNQTHAARLLDITRDALRYKLKKFELVPAGDEEPAADSVSSENSSN